MADALGTGTTQYFNMVRVLDNFFGKSSMAMGTESYSFLDFGYVYRCECAGVPITARPLCYPALLALMDLWGSVLPAAGPRLAQVVRESDAAGFEDLVWDFLLARGFSNGAVLPCHRLGADASVQQVCLKLTDYFVSHLNYYTSRQDLVNAEVAALLIRCRLLKMTLLYRCPRGSADVDFFVLSPDGSCVAIQTSLSTLTQHSRRYGGTVETINYIAPLYGITASRLRYIYITTQREQHRKIAASLSFVGIVDAASWLKQ
jgi:hypothetical protein